MTTETPRTLHAWAAEGVPLRQALAAFAAETGAGERCLALVYRPSACLFATVEGGELRDAEGRPVDLGSVFEARCFCERGELRFVHGAAGLGCAVYLSEEPPSPRLKDAGGVVWRDGAEPAPCRYSETLPARYLLWGRATERKAREGWTRLFTARIGPLDVPAAVEKGEGCQLLAREYVDYDEHGNAVVVEERLLGLGAGSK